MSEVLGVLKSKKIVVVAVLGLLVIGQQLMKHWFGFSALAALIFLVGLAGFILCLINFWGELTEGDGFARSALGLFTGLILFGLVFGCFVDPILKIFMK